MRRSDGAPRPSRPIGRSNVIGGVTSFGINGSCAGTDGVFRLDRSWSLDWITGALGDYLR